MRPTTLLKLEAPLHYTKGAEQLFITREIDKEGFERRVPLSAAAREALDRVCPDAGRLFAIPKGTLREHLRTAVAKAGLVDRAISTYDFKYTRISIGANSGAPLAGIAHLVGHKYVSTTALYVQTGEEAAAAALGVMARAPRRTKIGGHSGGHPSKTSAAQKPRRRRSG